MTTTVLNPATVSAPVGPYSQGILTTGTGNWLHIAGQIGATKEGVVPVSFAEQADLAWTNLRHVLAEAEMDVKDVVKVVTYVVGVENVPLLGPVRLAHLGEARPAATLIIVPALARSEWLVEIEAIAFRAD